MIRRLLSVSVLALSAALAACTPAQLAGLKTANTIAAGVACGIAAANDTPCTPQEALAQFAEGQKQIVALLAKQAEPSTDPAVLNAILQSMEANAASQRALAEQIIKLAEKGTPPAPAAPAPSAPPTTPPPVPAAPDPAPSAPVPPPSAPAPAAKPSTAS